ncbi:MAG: serine/threonine protein kinase [Candidatus Eisenbacteria bacterium]|uniref:Serine/threonine protein kinase n=1 Tax=Eiseniibacteriota bacterium TaxID=2212470 RepID=A0A7Y2H1D1_UNCEI|nr:serine/threonine protein kinase [Candidatus Eisenbacteria bacterium]
MSEQANPASISDTTPLNSSSGFSALDSQARSQTYRNLAAAAYVYAAVYFVAFWSGWLTSSKIRDERFAMPEAEYIFGSIFGIGLGLFVGWKARQRHLPVASFTLIAQLFLILSCLGIAFGAWKWQFHAFDPSFDGVHWVGVWIISFAATVTLPPRMLFRSAFIGSICIPLIGILSILAYGFPPHMEEALSFPTDLNAAGWSFFWQISATILVPIWICIGIAYVIAARVFHLAKDASDARRLGSYQLEEKLGQGGMGEVWRASHKLLARPAAVKLIREQGVASPNGEHPSTVLKRFEREAQATAALTSPHTVQLYDFGIKEDGTFYYVMELLHGLDLRSLIERTGPVPPARALHFLRQACDSLADAHMHGMVHRDIKPGNLFTCRKGTNYDFIKILDFGLVKESGRSEKGNDQLTRQGVASGTPAFMAPEMALEKAEIDGRADIYALGCVGYWLLTGELVFTADSAVAMMLKHVSEKPRPLSKVSELEIPESVESLIMDCLAKSPDDRPQSVMELGQRIEKAQQETGEWTAEHATSWWKLHLTEFTSPTKPSQETVVMDVSQE